jgi:biopolymer transport protein ExbD
MNVMGKTARLLVFILITLALAGCGAKVDLPAARVAPASSKAQVAVYLDSTVSMRGFVNYPTDTEYALALKAVEQALNIAWQDSELQFYRFGDKLRPLTRDEFLQAATPVFYKDDVTKLQDLIAGLNPDQVSILVTDLFQTDQDLQAVITTINNRFFKKDKVAALLGMTSRFNGDVYDIGAAGRRFRYQASDNPESFRPFFFLILGPQEEVLRFTSSYQKILPEGMNSRLLVYSDTWAAQGRLVPSRGLLPPGQRTYAATSSLLPEGAPYPQFLLKDHPGLLLLDYELTLPYAMQVTKPELSAGQLQIWKDGKFAASSAPALTKMEVLHTVSQEQSLSCQVALHLDPSKLPEHGIYRLQTALNPELGNYRNIQKVFTGWNMDVSGISGWNDANFPGNTTFNLNKFTDGLAEVAYATFKPSFSESWIYFKY